MKKLITLFAFASTIALQAQTEVRNASWTFSTGVHPTFSVVFNKTDARTVENWFKAELKSISDDMINKKEITAIGTRLPEVSGDTIRVLVKATQLKKSTDVTVHVAFRVNNTFIGPDSDERQRDGCRNWMYQNAVMLKKDIAQKELDAAIKQQGILDDQLAGLIKEKDRAQNNIEKTQENITEAEQEKVETEGSLTTMSTTIDAKKQEVSSAPTEANTKELQALLKEQEKLRRKSEKLTRDSANGKKKIEDLQFEIKKNLADQDTKSKAIDTQKKLVEELTIKLANVN